MKPIMGAIIRKMKEKKMNKGGTVCMAHGGIIANDLEPDTDGDVFPDDDETEIEYLEEENKKPKDRMSFVKNFFTSRAIRRK